MTPARKSLRQSVEEALKKANEVSAAFAEHLEETQLQNTVLELDLQTLAKDLALQSQRLTRTLKRQEAGLSATQAELASVQTSLRSVQEQVGEANDRLAALAGRESGLKATLSSVESRVDAFDTYVRGVEKNLQGLAAIAATSTEELKAVRAQLLALAQTIEKKEIDAKVDTIIEDVRSASVTGVFLALLFCTLLVVLFFLMRKKVVSQEDAISQQIGHLMAKTDALNEEIVQKLAASFAHLEQQAERLLVFRTPEEAPLCGAQEAHEVGIDQEASHKAPEGAEQDAAQGAVQGALQESEAGEQSVSREKAFLEEQHALVKRIADRIAFMDVTMSRMDSTIRGFKQLSKSIAQMKENLAANGYEIVEMLGKRYHSGMKVIANFIDDESLQEGEQIITGVTKPQVNYNGIMIQSAQITVSQNI